MALTGLASNNSSQPQAARPSAPQSFGQAHSHPATVPSASPQRQTLGQVPNSASPMPSTGLNRAPNSFGGDRPTIGSANGAETQAATDRNLEGISDKDIAFLTSLAAMQVQYGRPHEAVAYLMAVRRLRPSDGQILRLLAIALMKMDAWEQANVILDEMESLNGNDGPIVYLYRSIIRFRQSDLFGAKQLFARFCALKSGGNIS